jgi:hypothetical protein
VRRPVEAILVPFVRQGYGTGLDPQSVVRLTPRSADVGLDTRDWVPWKLDKQTRIVLSTKGPTTRDHQPTWHFCLDAELSHS